MKKILFIVFALIIASCSTENKQQEVLREVAKKDAIEKLQLPDGTTFNNENIEVTENQATDGSIGVNYLVKITIKSQDREGNEVVKTHTFNYKKTREGGLAPEDYELISFE